MKTILNEAIIQEWEKTEEINELRYNYTAKSVSPK